MNIATHPTFMTVWKRFFFRFAAFFIMSLCSIIYFGNHGYDATVKPLLAPYFVMVMGLFGYGIYLPYGVRCPQCGNKARTKSRRPELPDHWSAYCAPCDTLWDLQLGNSE